MHVGCQPSIEFGKRFVISTDVVEDAKRVGMLGGFRTWKKGKYFPFSMDGVILRAFALGTG
jgi:hypothetical protein